VKENFFVYLILNIKNRKTISYVGMQFEYNLKKNRKIRKQLIEKFISTTIDC